ncbi:MAG TPA: hypothetical protein G4O05_09555 [Caldilineae bacterium]|nr:hypothetical protein [Caldilineae bacterium]
MPIPKKRQAMAHVATMADIKAIEQVPLSGRDIPQMPVTAVGKIFKSALVRMQIQETLTAALNALEGMAQAAVEAVPSKLHGPRCGCRCV